MAYTTRMAYEALRSVDAADLDGSYQSIGDPLENPASIVKMVNNSDATVIVSVNGTDDHDVCPAGSFWLYDETANTPTGSTNACFLPKGTQILIKGSPGTGDIYLVVQYIVQV